tara:strand:+ start:1516 stop:2319 length:804 start_codon:yes stop_codon:yes gene_type:complete
MSLKKKEHITKKKVAIISYGNCANLGDRIGQNIILNMIPFDCYVDFLYLPPFWNKKFNDINYDLVIIGTGHSVFFKTLNDNNFIEFLDNQKKIIGVFGLQYHDLLDKNIFNDFTKKFKHIFVRNKKDLAFFNNKNIISHSGDILTSYFPLTNWTIDSKITINPKIINNLDDGLSIVKKIQAHKIVESSRLHPLLAGLQSCNEFIFHEQSEMGNEIKSNKFNNMLYDIFNKDFVPGVKYNNDKNSILEYRKFVFGNLIKIEDKIKENL